MLLIESSDEDIKKATGQCKIIKKGKKGDFFIFQYYYSIFNQYCFICRPSDSTVSENAGLEPRTVATLALAVRPLD
jgi:hypothetical protein